LRDVLRRLRDVIRPANSQDAWIGEPPTRDQLEERIGNDAEAKHVLFDWSMAEFVERYLQDERLQMAYLGQGVIGTNASPFDPGTASIRFHHASGRQGGLPGAWGYVTGGMGMISIFIADAAREAGVVIVSGIPVAEIVLGEGVVVESGERINAPVVVSNADPRRTLAMLGSDADPAWREKVEAIPQQGCTLKLNVWLRELPNFRARPGTCEPHHFGQINTPLSRAEWKAGYRAAREGRLPDRLWTEIYFQSVHDPPVAPAGTHTMSVFSQYVPYKFADDKTWDDYREAAKQLALDALARFCSNIPDAVIEAEAIGPPDIERRVGLTGGHIFQGECLPAYMWSNRLSARTPMPGVYLCGACTHPGGSVIAMNGRNAAMAVLDDTGSASAVSAAD
jgi:phytoene dehydrogenase-like protein